MQGICTFCGRSTSTQKTERCKVCYQEEIRKKYSKINAHRNNQIIKDIVENHITAARTARKYNLSREAIRLILKKNNINYQKIKKEIRKERNKEKAKIEKIKRTKYCLWCKKKFIVNRYGARVKYCSMKCYKKRHKKLQRERVRKYLQAKRQQAS